MKFYNSLTKSYQEFKPYGEEVHMYSCGPTVYNTAHIGNMRAYIFMDEIYRTLRYFGFKVNGVMNITDVGHLTSDADEGDDKMLVASKRENKSPWEIAKHYTDLFLKDIKELNVTMPTHIVPATSVIEEIIEFVKTLLEKGYAYETSKGIYYDINKFKDYGKLGGASQDDKIAGSRIEIDEEKHNPADFALWIRAPKEHIMQWPSPWGMGYPGWHIECSAIGHKFFGTEIDIHTGGMEHKTLHHENEIAQNDALNGKQTVKYWIHGGFLNVDGKKMSKSLGNVYTLPQIIEKGYSAMDFRYFLYNSHYAKVTNFTIEALNNARKSFKQLLKLINSHKVGTAKINAETLKNYKNEFDDAIADDLNMPLALGITWKMLKNNEPSKEIYDLFIKFNEIFGFILEESEDLKPEIPEDIKQLAQNRWQAKLAKDFKTADTLRQELLTKGYEILDSKDGYEINKK